MIEFDSPDKFIGTTAALILGGLSAAGAIGGSAIAAHASTSAAQTQSDAAAKAADYTKTTTGNALDYINASRSQIPVGNLSPSYGMLSQRLGIGPSNPQPGMATGYGARFGMGQPTGMVQMMAPSGERQSVPREQVPHFQSLGARLV